MSNQQGNCTSDACEILPIANALTPKSHENACDSVLILVSIDTAFLNLKCAITKSVQLWK